MTTGFLKDKQCFVCGSQTKIADIGGTVQYQGSRDLDGRPSTLQRSSIYMLVQRCGTCGYCAPDISAGMDSMRDRVFSREYKHRLNDNTFPETAASFICHAFLLESDGQSADAGWAYLCAAWVCDDGPVRDKARYNRKKAIACFLNARSSGGSFADSPSEEALMLVDLSRRSGQFAEAKKQAGQALAESPGQPLESFLAFELDLIEQKDDRCHTREEAGEQ